MTQPIRKTLAQLPDGQYGYDLRDEELAEYLREHCNREVDKQREKDHQLRDILFADGGVKEMNAKIDRWFENEQVKNRVKRMVEDARFSNVTKRIVSEMSTVYAEPATRSVGGSDENQRKYDDLVESMCLDEENDRVNQQFNLHRAIIVQPRVRMTPTGTPEVVLDVQSAATARAVMHPNDNTMVVAWLTRIELRSVRGGFDRPAAWLLTSDHEWEYLDEDFMPIKGTNVEHGLGVNPWIPISSGSKSQPDFWPGDEGADITAGHLVGWLFHSLLVKETKTATRQPVFQGDASTVARGQALDSAGMFEAPEGTTVTTVEIGTDVEVFIKADDHQLERVANNHGLSMAALTHQGVQSAEARELGLAPVRERRRKQVKLFRRYERQLAVVLSVVTKKAAPSLAFDALEWRIDFGEPQVLLSKQERLAIFEKERGLGLDNTVAFLMRENPDLTFEQAWAQALDNIEIETKRVVAMRDLQAASGGMNTPIPSNPAEADSATGGVPATNDSANGRLREPMTDSPTGTGVEMATPA